MDDGRQSEVIFKDHQINQHKSVNFGFKPTNIFWLLPNYGLTGKVLNLGEKMVEIQLHKILNFQFAGIYYAQLALPCFGLSARDFSNLMFLSLIEKLRDMEINNSDRRCGTI